MGWKCYSCGTENSKSDAMCKKCGNTVAAPKSFYASWIVGAMIFFMVFYLAGVLAGGVLVEAVANPSEEAILAAANKLRKPGTDAFNNMGEVEFAQQAAARAMAVATAKAAMPAVIRGLIQWTLPALLFVICGIIVGFISDGVTIIEAALGSVLGQAAAVALIIYAFGITSVGWVAFAVGVVPGAALGSLGAYLGEVFQARKEQAGGITG